MSIEHLFTRSRRYVVPLFQRPYVWGEEGEWAPLWEDIRERAEEILERDGEGQTRIRDHFLGAIVLHQIPTFGKQLAAVEVIDGQQRLTTLQLMLAAFRDLVPRSEEDLVIELLGLTKNRGVMAGPTERFKVWPTNADRGVFETVMNATSVDAVEAAYPQIRRKYKRSYEPRPRLVEAYLYFSRAIRDFCVPGGEESFDTGRAYAILEALRKHLQLVVIELEEGDDPQVIFETLNARGVPLLPSDLVRNYIFLQAGRNDENADELYTRLWQDYDERPAETGHPEGARFWKLEERQGRLKRTRLDLFLYHYVLSRSEAPFSLNHLYEAFREWWETDRSRRVGNELTELRRHSDLFAQLIVPPGDSRLDRFAQRLKTLDTAMLYPVLLYLCGTPGRVKEVELNGIVEDLESYVVRRMVCGFSTKNYNKFFLGLVRRLRQHEVVDRSHVQAFLLDGRGSAAEWPSDAAFQRAWLNKPVDILLQRGRAAMVLEALEEAMRSSKTEGVQYPGSLTVEHVLPQQWRESDYPLPAPAQGEDEEVVRSRRYALLHSFGNLTLLTQSLNSSVSNGPFPKKRDQIAEHSLLKMNTAFRGLSEWGEADILARGSELFEVAKQIWPRAAVREEGES